MRWDENDEMGLEWDDENNSFGLQRWLTPKKRLYVTFVSHRYFQRRATCILAVFFQNVRTPRPINENWNLLNSYSEIKRKCLKPLANCLNFWIRAWVTKHCTRVVIFTEDKIIVFKIINLIFFFIEYWLIIYRWTYNLLHMQIKFDAL